jgi:hypothetical protein
LIGVAKKLGTDWNTLRELNIKRCGASLKASSVFKPHALLSIPKIRSQWKMKQLQVDHLLNPAETCIECGSANATANNHGNANGNPDDGCSALSLCNGCNAACHAACVGVTAVADEDWFCRSCVAILEARKQHHSQQAQEGEAHKGHHHQLPSQAAATVDCSQTSGNFSEP